MLRPAESPAPGERPAGGSTRMSAADALRLEVAEFADPNRWRWRLTTAQGAFLADHQVALDPADQLYQAFVDLHVYLDQHADPEKWPGDEERLVFEAGAWIGERVLGPVGAAI